MPRLTYLKMFSLQNKLLHSPNLLFKAGIPLTKADSNEEPHLHSKGKRCCCCWVYFPGARGSCSKHSPQSYSDNIINFKVKW